MSNENIKKFSIEEIIYILRHLGHSYESKYHFQMGALFVHLKILGYDVHNWKKTALNIEEETFFFGKQNRRETFYEWILRQAENIN